MTEFVSEDDLKTFEGWLQYQAVDKDALSAGELAQWRAVFDDAQKDAAKKVGLMKIRPVSGEYRYAVAVRDERLWLALWIRRNMKGEVFILIPRSKDGWNPHSSYHLDGRFHQKSFDKARQIQQRQPLGPGFQGTEHLGTYAGYGPKSVGAVCDPGAFTGVLEVEKDILGPVHGAIAVDLVKPGSAPIAWPLGGSIVVAEIVFKDVEPWIYIRVGSPPS